MITYNITSEKSFPYNSMDNVICTNCGWFGLVKKCSEKCLGCGHVGWLAWKENEPKEILL